MRKNFTLYLVVVLALVASAAHAQVGTGFYNTVNWKFSNPKQFGFTVLDVDFFDNTNVIAVGNDGGIAKSADGGAHWSYGPFTFVNATGARTKSSLTDVHYVSANVAYVVGSGGCMAKTTDGGTTWNFIQTPLFANSKNINTCWFVNENKGYIAGQFNTLDSIPKLYFTNNGGSTWDSMAAPIGGKTVVGYINNPNLPPLAWDIDAKGKEIYRIEFSNDNTGYVLGGGSSLFPKFPSAVAATCLPTGATSTTGSNNASLVWKFSNGTLTDYSLSKERMGYTGINSNTITCTTTFGSITPQSQQFRALNIINDSTVVVMSYNNNIVVKIKTGVNDSTLNVNLPGIYEKGKYEMLNFPFPPTAGPNAGTPIPATQVLLATNPYTIKKASNGKLFAPTNFGNLWTSVDTGRTWVQEKSLPQGQNYSNNATWAMDISPAGKFMTMGANGVVADSTAGGVWQSTYLTMPLAAAHTKADFPDCNNGILAGGSSITVTEDGGNTWIDKARPDFAASFYNIGGLAYPTLTKSYFAVSNGVVYVSTDKGTTLDPAYSNFNFQMLDVAAIGNDTVWAVGYNQFTIPAASRTSNVFRSFDGGTTWTAITGFPVGTTAPTLSKISFASRTTGYVAGTRNSIYKTIDGGTTWTSINPFPSLNEGPTGFPNTYISYTEVQAVNENIVFAIGNMFTSTGIKRVYKSIDGGTTWADITGNIPTLQPVGNLIGLDMQDADNGYVTAGSSLFKTTDGGVTWIMDIAPINSLFETMAFAPRTVPAGIPFENRKLFVTGISAPTANAAIMEYGNPANIAVNTTEVVTNTNCSTANAGSIVITAAGGLPPYSYSINGGAFQAGNSFAGLTQGNYTIVIKDAFCGILTKTVAVAFDNNLALAVTPADTTVCSGAPVQLTATNITGATYAWSPSAGLSSSTISNPVATAGSNNTTYTVTATLGTCVKTATSVFTIKASPAISAGADKTIVAGDEVMLEGSVFNGAGSILWTPSATLNNPTSLTPFAKPAATTVYTLTVKDNNNCTSTDAATVTVLPYCIKINNAFTPNGDGINEKWIVTNGSGCTTQIGAKVYNRYGSLVYSNDNYQNDWDGTYKGKAIPDATYYYVLTYKLINNKVITLKGDVTILR